MAISQIWLTAAADATSNDAGSFPQRTFDQIDAVVLAKAPAEDIAIMERLRVNDEKALRELMDRLGPAVLRVAFHYVKREDIAYDIAQDVFIALWGRRHTLNHTAPLVHYLRRAARNRALDCLKQNASQARLAASVKSENATSAFVENTGFMSARAAEVDRAVRKIVDRLTPRVREVLLLYYERQLEPGEIAALLGVAPRTVYSQLRTALRALAVSLAVYEDED